MKCTEVSELLSAYHDGELAPDAQAAVAKHLADCPDCGQTLAEYRRMSELAEKLNSPQPPSDLWHGIEEQLSQGPGDRAEPTGFQRRWKAQSRPAMSLGFIVALVAIGLAVWLGYRNWLGHHDTREFTAAFGHFLDDFPINPSAAESFLLGKYDGQATSLAKIPDSIGYRPAIANGLPRAYSLKNTYILTMPCCTCVQAICEHVDGRTIAIFEHDDEEISDWFGDRTVAATSCNGVPCTFIELEKTVAVTWTREPRHLTVIGLQSKEEIAELVTWLGDSDRE